MKDKKKKKSSSNSEKKGPKKSFSFDSKKQKEKMKKNRERDEGGGKSNFMKLNYQTEILILPALEGGDIIKRTQVHEVWKNQKPIMKATCARALDEKCKVCEYGFDRMNLIKDAVKKGKRLTKSEEDSWKTYMPAKASLVNAIKISFTEKKKGKKIVVAEPEAEVLKLPEAAYAEALDAIDKSKDMKDVCDLDKGRTLTITSNGAKGKLVRYPKVELSSNGAKLLKKELVDEEEIINQMHDLDKLQPEFSEKALDKVLAELKKLDPSKKMKSEDVDEDDDEDDDDEEDTKSSKKKKGKKSSKDDDEEEDEDDDSDEDDDEDDSDSDDDDEDEDDSDDDDSDDEEDDEDDSDDEDDDESDDDDEDSDDDDDSDEDEDEDEDDEDSDESDDDDNEDEDEEEEKSSKKSKLKKKGKEKSKPKKEVKKAKKKKK